MWIIVTQKYNNSIEMKLINAQCENECNTGSDNVAEVLNLSMKK